MDRRAEQQYVDDFLALNKGLSCSGSSQNALQTKCLMVNVTICSTFKEDILNHLICIIQLQLLFKVVENSLVSAFSCTQAAKVQMGYRYDGNQFQHF